MLNYALNYERAVMIAFPCIKARRHNCINGAFSIFRAVLVKTSVQIFISSSFHSELGREGIMMIAFLAFVCSLHVVSVKMVWMMHTKVITHGVIITIVIVTIVNVVISLATVLRITTSTQLIWLDDKATTTLLSTLHAMWLDKQNCWHYSCHNYYTWSSHIKTTALLIFTHSYSVFRIRNTPIF